MRYLSPLIIFLIIAAFLWKGLHHDPHKLPSALIDKAIPEFNYPSLLDEKRLITQKEFLGQVSLLNIWGTWCITCRQEHPVLTQIAKTENIIIYGLDYKDNVSAAKKWLKELGNPYKDVILDQQGKLAIDFGAYGTPETFVIDAKGIIRYKHVGPITWQDWQNKIKPVVKKWQ